MKDQRERVLSRLDQIELISNFQLPILKLWKVIQFRNQHIGNKINFVN